MTCRYRTRLTATPGLCRGCGTPLKRNKDGSVSKARFWCGEDCALFTLRHHDWGWAQPYALKLGNYRCSRGDDCKGRLEVNHIGPRYGQGYGVGCWNHQDNLEVLCHEHHLAVTALQRAAREQGGQIRMEAEA